MLAGMGLLLDSFWRAMAYCLHKRVIAWSLFPLLFMALTAWLLGYFYWADAVVWTEGVLEGVGWLHTVWSWMGVQSVPHLVAPVLVVLSVTPVLVVASLLLVALFMTPALVELVAQRRFPALERRKGATLVGSLLWSAGSSLIALIALLVSVPLWFVPPLVVVIPPLIWGWLTYRVMAFDALSAHASKPERRSLFLRHRLALMLMGVVFIAAFWILIPVAIWLYALIFAFSSLWFAHFCLAALQRMREEEPLVPEAPVVPYAPDAPDAPQGAGTASPTSIPPQEKNP
jgi:hypothetical protein